MPRLMIVNGARGLKMVAGFSEEDRSRLKVIPDNQRSATGDVDGDSRRRVAFIAKGTLGKEISKFPFCIPMPHNIVSSPLIAHTYESQLLYLDRKTRGGGGGITTWH